MLEKTRLAEAKEGEERERERELVTKEFYWLGRWMLSRGG